METSKGRSAPANPVIAHRPHAYRPPRIGITLSRPLPAGVLQYDAHSAISRRRYQIGRRADRLLPPCRQLHVRAPSRQLRSGSWCARLPNRGRSNGKVRWGQSLGFDRPAPHALIDPALIVTVASMHQCLSHVLAVSCGFSTKVLIWARIKSRADALANLPVPGQGGFRESGDVAAPATKRGRHSSALLGANRWRVFTCQRTSSSAA